ncbi:single-stranded DNA-binding protein [Roseateles sp. PN1]|uniref:single-stranded DNA-binding protein n=1 Tax=Roseateles sp. PN1 TaxID=3137372 RepID=UPI003138802B
MASVNRVTLIGNLGKDPELRYNPSGVAFCTISLATTRSWKDKQSGEKQEETEWHRVVFNDKLAEIVGQYCKKGKPLYVEGRLRTRKWQDKEGRDTYTTEIIADQMQLLGGRDDGDSLPGQEKFSQARAPAPAPRAPAPRRPGEAAGYGTGGTPARPGTGFDGMDDDIPF